MVRNKSTPRNADIHLSTNEVMAFLFWNAYKLILIDNKYYVLLKHLRRKSQKQKKKRVMFHQNKAHTVEIFFGNMDWNCFRIPRINQAWPQRMLTKGKYSNNEAVIIGSFRISCGLRGIYILLWLTSNVRSNFLPFLRTSIIYYEKLVYCIYFVDLTVSIHYFILRRRLL